MNGRLNQTHLGPDEAVSHGVPRPSGRRRAAVVRDGGGLAAPALVLGDAGEIGPGSYVAMADRVMEGVAAIATCHSPCGPTVAVDGFIVDDIPVSGRPMRPRQFVFRYGWVATAALSNLMKPNYTRSGDAALFQLTLIPLMAGISSPFSDHTRLSAG